MLYSNFTAFTKDQESLISMDNDTGVDYVEGQLLMSNGIVDTSFFPPSNQSKVADLVKNHSIIYVLEVAKYYDDPSLPIIGQVQAYFTYFLYGYIFFITKNIKPGSIKYTNLTSGWEMQPMDRPSPVYSNES